MNDTFKSVPADKIPNLLKCLEMQLPKAAMLHNITKCYLEDRFSKDTETQLLSMNDNFDETFSTSNFVFAVQLRKQNKSLTEELVTLLAPENPSQEMLIALERTINWTSPLAFASVDSNLAECIKEMCVRQGKLSGCSPCFSFAMMIPKALSLSIRDPSDSVTIRELTEDCAAQVTTRWKFAGEGTVDSMRDAISTMGSSGVFVNSDLVSWVIAGAHGSMYSLYTEDDHRRKGYGELAMKFCMKLIAERGLVPNVQVELPNLISKMLMEKWGLEFSHDVEWIIYKPQHP